MGASAGGFSAFNKLLPEFPPDFAAPIIIVYHMHYESDEYTITELNKKCPLAVKTAEDKEPVNSGYIYFGPPDYHLLIEQDKTFSLSIAGPVNYARPAIDVLFESASDVYRNKLIGVILTGANDDGSKGLHMIKSRGGTTVVQNPKKAEVSRMPESAVKMTNVNFILNLDEIAAKLIYIMYN
jgi:two-component system chemotaxis response regulator CheB